MLDVRRDFPFLDRPVRDGSLIYFDNAATTQKPRVVIDRITGLLSSGIANVHRAVNFLADEVTEAFEGARETVSALVGTGPSNLVFTAGATHAINLVCRSLSADGPVRVLATSLEHHSNLLPWRDRGEIIWVRWDPQSGAIDLGDLRERLRLRPHLVAMSRASNFLGTLQPVAEINAAAREAGVPVLVDASQSIAHERHDLDELGCDFLVFSAHKMYGPSGVGVLAVSDRMLARLRPLLLGGQMVKEVRRDDHVLNDVPHRFEAGTPNIEGVIGFAAAVDYVQALGYDAIAGHEAALVQHAKRRLAQLPGIRSFGPPAGAPCAPLVAFSVAGLQSGDVAKILANRANVIVRSGFHCAQPAHDAVGAGPTLRVSFAVYNTTSEIDRMIGVLETLREVALV